MAMVVEEEVEEEVEEVVVVMEEEVVKAEEDVWVVLAGWEVLVELDQQDLTAAVLGTDREDVGVEEELGLMAMEVEEVEEEEEVEAMEEVGAVAAEAGLDPEDQ